MARRVTHAPAPRRAVRARGLSFRVPRAKTATGGKAALKGPPKGPQKLIGPRSWKHISLKTPNPPRVGSGKGGLAVFAAGVGARTQRVNGPSIF
jgi:hypothetical protein